MDIVTYALCKKLASQNVAQKEELVTTPVIGSVLTLTADKYQLTTMKDNLTIVLPTVNGFTEIHLFFKTTSELTLMLPNIKWSNLPTLEANKTFEFKFIYTTEWLGDCVVYS